jgi:cytochrome c biogenesis protein CcmG, thiol:disulfide interchange protein DsbE
MKLPVLSAGMESFSNVTILGANATDLYFTHQYGIGNVKLKYLSPELQKRFNYDPKIAAQVERQRADDDARYQREVAASVARQTVLQPTNGLSAAESLADPISDKSLLGKPAPPLSLNEWLTDKPVLEGKFVLISFWAPGSAASRHWIPELNTLQKEFTNRLAVVGLTTDSEAAVTNMAEPKITFASALDPEGRLRAAVGVTSVPTVMLVDPKGIVCYLGHPAALTPSVLQKVLAKPPENGH